ncbi:MAG: hypothetical protein ACRD36_05205, partial [Candidatus Acidiferrum sp.]
MVQFQRVDAGEAGPSALGILIPPGRRTILIVRPRHLEFDLVLMRPEGQLGFCELTHDQASRAGL